MSVTPRILLVDDEAHIRLLYRTELEAAGYEVDELPNGNDLLETLTRACPDLVVLDIRMPGRSGLELLTSVRALHRRLPIILSSAYSSYQGDMSTLPADAYVLKSSDVTPLLDTVRSLLDERRNESSAPRSPPAPKSNKARRAQRRMPAPARKSRTRRATRT